jgi:hypothetical protein
MNFLISINDNIKIIKRIWLPGSNSFDPYSIIASKESENLFLKKSKNAGKNLSSYGKKENSFSIISLARSFTLISIAFYVIFILFFPENEKSN